MLGTPEHFISCLFSVTTISDLLSHKMLMEIGISLLQMEQLVDENNENADLQARALLEENCRILYVPDPSIDGLGQRLPSS